MATRASLAVVFVPSAVESFEMCPKCEPLELTREVKVLNAPLEAEFPSLLSPKEACNPKSDEELDAKVRPLLFSLAPVPA